MRRSLRSSGVPTSPFAGRPAAIVEVAAPKELPFVLKDALGRETGQESVRHSLCLFRAHPPGVHSKVEAEETLDCGPSRDSIQSPVERVAYGL